MFNPHEVIDEWARLLKPNGLLLVTTPFIWPEHEVPYDFGRYSSHGLKHVLEEHGFEIVEFQRVGGELSVLGQLFLYSRYSWPWAPFGLGRVLRWALLLLVNGICRAEKRRLARDDDSFYLGNVVLARKAG